MSEREIPLSVPNLSGNERRYLEECLETTFVSSVGPFVTQFEDMFVRTVNARHAVACVSGTAALHVGLQVAGIGHGDEVFVSDFTFVATVNPLAYLGARPLLVDAISGICDKDHEIISVDLEQL